MYTAEEIESRTELSQRMFHQIEGYMIDFLNYVPFDRNHLEVYSLKLTTIILEVGPELINSFELAVAKTRIYPMHEMFDDSLRADREELWEKEKRLRSKKRSLTFNDYYRFLSKHGIPRLSGATIQLRNFGVYMTPFEEANPEWWENYNRIRHDKYNNLKKATLRTALKASGALFWLVDSNSRWFSFEKPFDSTLFFTTESYKIDSSLEKL